MDALPGRRLAIVVPAFDEAAAIGEVVRSLANEPRLRAAKILVVDDGSSDETAAEATEAGATVLRNRANQGYGASLRRAFHATDRDLVAWFDADGQHRASDLADMLELIAREEADAVFGSRSEDSHTVRSRVLGKSFLKRAAQWIAGQPIEDVNCGLRIFRRAVLARYLHLLPMGFSASTTSTLLFLKTNRHVLFHSIVAPERIGKSSARQLRDGMRTLHSLLRVLIMFSALRTFAVVAAFFVVAGFAYGLTVALFQGLGFPVLGALSVILGVQALLLGVVCDQVSAMRLEKIDDDAGDLATSGAARKTS